MRRIYLLATACLLFNAAPQLSFAQGDTYDLTVGARLCGAADEVGNTCQPMDGIVITVEDDAGNYLGECTTQPYDGAGSTCTIPVPLGSTVTASVSPDSMPANTTMSTVNRTVKVPADANANQDAVPTFSFIDDSVLEPTEGAVEQPAETDPGDDGTQDDAGSSGEIEQQPAEDVLAEDLSTDSTDAASVQPEVRHRFGESDSQRLQRFFDDWAVIGLLGIAVIGVLILSINLVRGGRK